MRWLVALIIVIVPVIAAAKPSVAVAPFEGDDGNKVALAVAKALDEEGGVVIGPRETGKAMEKLGLSGKLDKKDQKKLRKKLDVDVIVQGKVEDKSVELRLAGKGVTTSRFEVKYKSASSTKFRGELREALGKRLSPGKDEEEEEERVAEEPADDEVKVKKKRKKRRDDDEESEPAVRHVVTQAAIRGNAGAGFARRGLTYGASGGMQPPPVGTAAPSVRVEVEAYPGAMETLRGIAAGFGVYGHFDRAVLLSIDVPGGGNAPITSQHYSIGARYRYVFGQHSIAAGIGYASRVYEADRSGLGMKVLDMPDTKYSAIAPNVVARIAATPTVGVFFGGAFELLLGAGGITEDFGYAKTLAFDVAGGADIAISGHYGLRIAAELSQVSLSFSTPKRGVSSATDRTIGLTASFEVLY